MTVNGNEIFSVPAEAFAISPSSEGYQIMTSVDSQVWDEYQDAVPSDENCYVKTGIVGLLYKLEGNNSKVKVKF